jgi:hypothetical protein
MQTVRQRMRIKNPITLIMEKVWNLSFFTVISPKIED